MKNFKKKYKSKIFQEDCISYSTMLSPLRHNMGLGPNLFLVFFFRIFIKQLRDLDFVKVLAVFAAVFTANLFDSATSNLKAEIETLTFLFSSR